MTKLRKYLSDLDIGACAALKSPLLGPTGQMVVIIKHIEIRQTERYMTRGFRFAPPQAVASNIAASLRISKEITLGHLKDLAAYKPLGLTWMPGWYAACFGVQAQVRGGFRIMVPSQKRQILPLAKIQDDDPSIVDRAFVNRHHGLELKDFLDSCQNMANRGSQNTLETFRDRTGQAIQHLSATIADPEFLTSRMASFVVTIPCVEPFAGANAQLILFRYSVSLHHTRLASGLDWAPLSLFDTFNSFYAARGEDLEAKFAREISQDLALDSFRLAQDTTSLEKDDEIRNKDSNDIVVHREFDVKVETLAFQDEGALPLGIRPQFSAVASRENWDAVVPSSWVEQALKADGDTWDDRRISTLIE